jgi:hypothetical protein
MRSAQPPAFVVDHRPATADLTEMSPAIIQDLSEKVNRLGWSPGRSPKAGKKMWALSGLPKIA